MSRCNRRESNPTNLGGPGETFWNKPGELAGTQLCIKPSRPANCASAAQVVNKFEADIWYPGVLRGRFPNPRPLLAAGYAASLIPVCFRLGSGWRYRDPCMQLARLHSDPWNFTLLQA